MSIIDTSAFCGTWPFRALPGSAAEVKTALQPLGITQAWVAPIDGAFHLDPMDANERLEKEIAGDEFFLRVGVVNALMQGWQVDAEHCIATLECRALKVFPNYQNVECSGPAMRELAEMSVELKVPLCVQMRLQDERGHHLLKAPGVPPLQIAELANSFPKARIVACGAYLGDLKLLSSAKNVWAEISFCESGRALPDVLKVFPSERTLFATHAPMHYPAPEVAKLRGSAEDLHPDLVRKVSAGNARDLLAF